MKFIIYILISILTAFDLNARPPIKPSFEKQYLDAKKTITSAPVGNGINEISNNIKNNTRYWKQFSSTARDKMAKIADGASSVISAIDIASTAGDAAGYLVEGDLTGATGVILSDFFKRGTVALTTGAGSLTGVPGGSIVGGAIGEQLHKDLIAPVVEKKTDEQRDREYQKKYLMQPPRQSIIDKNGRVRQLPADMYMDKDGLVHRRSPEEQQAFIKKWHKERSSYKKNRDVSRERQAQALSDAYLSKEISTAEFNSGMKKVMNDASADLQSEIQELDELKEKIAAEQEEEKRRKEQERLENLKAAGQDFIGSNDIDEVLKELEPMRMVADTEFTEEGLKHKMVLGFWNVGSMITGYGKATLAIDSTVVGNFEYWGSGKRPTATFRGSFTGGPNGTFHLSGEGETIKGKMVNGKIVILEGDLSLKVRTPRGFVNWPER